MKVPDKLLLASLGVIVVPAIIILVLAWEVPDANALEVKPPVARQAYLIVVVASLRALKTSGPHVRRVGAPSRPHGSRAWSAAVPGPRRAR